MEIIENKTQRDKEMRNMKDKSHNTDNRVRRSNVYLLGNPEGEEKRG